MEPNGIGGGLFPEMRSGMLGLEMPLHQTQNPPNPQNPHHHMHQPQMVSYAHQEADHNHHPQAHQSAKHGYPYATKPKQITLSDEDEPGFGADDSAGENKRKISPWQRMKWTDTMVRLLIMAVFYIGDEGGSEGPDPTGKKKSGGGLLQKKGKWKSVSRAMMEKGFYVSPQQCEDKFNDLNKRYKRVNDILGKGTACKVVENQGLLEKMELSSKMKDEVKKLLNSKHLFFREMCAYHNSCGHGTVGAAGASGAHNSSPEDPSEVQLQQQQQQPQQERCFHVSENAHVVANSGRTETEGSKMFKAESGGEDEDEDYEDDGSEDDDDEEEEGVVEGGSRGQIGHGHEDEDENEHERAKRPRKGSCFSGSSHKMLMQQLGSEVSGVIQDVSKSPWEKKQWMKARLIQLEEQQVNYQYQSFELEKQRLKWVKYSSKKERDMETAKLENERRRLENERMLLLVRQKELELLDLHHHQQQQHQQQNSSNKRSDPSSLTG
ncbi:RNA polymerase II degradation factor 1 [Rosa rugosa]|uniref:RNA polymerase II degradation factor 1 n=1 Tax=Rosa rugosa TaxID=74645 RepID=UPI002B4055A5|nr:RNA polymerase II degradation factor 1 [Rosa rugosa]